ncbi:MAG: TVP38/TMEM64 family protein [Phormidesmis sp.]
MDTTWIWLRRKRVWAALAIASCLAVLISHLPLLSWLATSHQWIASQGIWALPTFVVLYVVAAVLGLPNIVLILAAGTLFGLTEGVISASIADTLSIAACFVIGQTVGRRWITSLVRENSRFHKLDRAFSQKCRKLVFLTRLSPVLPSNILNYGFSLTQINFWEYLFFSWLGMIPVIFTYVYVGTFGVTMLTLNHTQPENLAFQALGLIATVGVMVHTTKLTASALSMEESADADVVIADVSKFEVYKSACSRNSNTEPKRYPAAQCQQIRTERVRVRQVGVAPPPKMPVER